MQSLLIFHSNDQPFAVEAVQRIFQSESGFQGVRFNEPGGAVLEAIYADPQESTIVRLNGNRETISLSGTTDAAFHAALILQRHLQAPLRIIDTDYSFDLTLGDFANV